MRALGAAGAVVAAGAAGGYLLSATGALSLDLGVGRRTRPLGPVARSIAAPREVVWDVIAAPYLGRTPRAMDAKLRVLERGTDMVLAEHFTPVGLGMRATTVETVRFERPARVAFRLVRGPVPHVTEAFDLTPTEAGTEVLYTGEIGADLWGFGEWWTDRVAPRWEQAVVTSLADIAAEAQRRARVAPLDRSV